MSHYACLVIGDNPEQQLAPYNEGIEVPEYKIESGEMSTYNPQSKWDWYILGGRWKGFFKLKKNEKGIVGKSSIFNNKRKNDCDQARKKDIVLKSIKPTFAVVKDGKWYERGEMGWWAYALNEKEKKEWEKEFKKLIADLPNNTLLSVYDLHI